MPQCVFNSCKNNARKSNSTAGVSYFRFPSNPFTCAEWISIVARERKDNFYIPAKNSVICSDHFDKLDITGNTNRRRLDKSAIPKLQTQLPSTDSQLSAPNTKLESDIEVQSSSSCSGLDITPKRNSIQDQTVSDLISGRKTLKKRLLNKQLLTARKIIDDKSKKIQTLQKVNKRLVIKIRSLKNIVKLLKKKQTRDCLDILIKKC